MPRGVPATACYVARGYAGAGSTKAGRGLSYLLLKYLHVLGAIALLGTGTGIAFFMLAAHLSGEPGHVARTAGTVVRADALFTATAAVVQPITGALLIAEAGWDWREPWVLASLGLYVFVGLFWLPVVWMQARMRDLARDAALRSAPLPGAYHRLFRLWFLFGVPGFGGTMAILWLMIAKPGLWS